MRPVWTTAAVPMMLVLLLPMQLLLMIVIIMIADYNDAPYYDRHQHDDRRATMSPISRPCGWADRPATWCFSRIRNI